MIRLHGGHEPIFGDCYLTVYKGLQGDVLGGCENAKVSWWKFAAHPAPRCFQNPKGWSIFFEGKKRNKPLVIGFWNLGLLKKYFWLTKCTDSESKEAFSIHTHPMGI